MGLPDFDELPPTEQLCLETLAARFRLGEDIWTFKSNVTKALESLEDKGYVFVVHGVIPKSIRARLTPEGVRVMLDESYTPRLVQYYQDLLGSIWLYINWNYVTRQLTTPEKEMFADAVEAWSARLNQDNGEKPTTVERWWRE